jgi:hypothetical protein
MPANEEVTNGEIVRRLDSLHEELRHMSSSFVRTELYESQRQDSGRRVGDLEHEMAEARAIHDRDIAELRTQRDADKLENDRRNRTIQNMFIGGGISIFGGAGLLLFQLVAK